MRVRRSACRRGIRRSLPRGLVVALLIVSPRQGIADDEKATADKPAERAEAIMQSHLQTLKFSLAGAGDDKVLQVVPQALLKYSDPARRYLAGGVWRIGKSGRPEGLVSQEIWSDGADPDRGTVRRELISFRSDGLDMTSSAGISWHPRDSMLEFKPLSDAPRPAQTAEWRLLQMKELARSFEVKESYQGDVSVLRLLPRPIDRYEDRERGIDDGAMFAFTYGTNPELVLLLECHDKGWRFAVARLSWAELNIERGDAWQQVFPEIRMPGPGRNDAYASNSVPLLLPQHP